MDGNSLISLEVDQADGVELLRAMIGALAEYCQICAVSSVFRVSGDKKNRLEKVIFCAVWVKFDIGVDEIVEAIRNIEHKASTIVTHIQPVMRLLAFEDHVRLSSTITVPHPSLARDPVTTACCAELWGSYSHPVVHRSLEEISRELVSAREFEYFCQGKAAYDTTLS